MCLQAAMCCNLLENDVPPTPTNDCLSCSVLLGIICLVLVLFVVGMSAEFAVAGAALGGTLGVIWGK